MIFAPAAQHALRALIYLAGKQGMGPVLIRDIAAAQAIPRPYLAKILHRLRFNGLLRSTKGPGGGYELARDAASIRVGEIVGVFDEHRSRTSACILGDGPCSDRSSCPLHERWKQLRDEFATSIGSLTLAELAEPRRQPGGTSAPAAWRPRAARVHVLAPRLRRPATPKRARRKA